MQKRSESNSKKREAVRLEQVRLPPRQTVWSIVAETSARVHCVEHLLRSAQDVLKVGIVCRWLFGTLGQLLSVDESDCLSVSASSACLMQMWFESIIDGWSNLSG